MSLANGISKTWRIALTSDLGPLERGYDQGKPDLLVWVKGEAISPQQASLPRLGIVALSFVHKQERRCPQPYREDSKITIPISMYYDNQLHTVGQTTTLICMRLYSSHFPRSNHGEDRV